ncbi:MAG: hypothetical protein ABJI96_05060 [Paracoccaceae bacterium]
MITAGVIDRHGEFFVLFEDDNCIDDECILGHARRVQERLVITPLLEPEEVVSILALPKDWGFDHSVALLGADGEFTLANSISSQKTIIAGAGYTDDTALRLGRMTTLKLLGSTIYAMGYGGQVYYRTSKSDWSSILVGGEDAETKSPACLYAVAKEYGEKVMYFGGTNIQNFLRTEEMAAAGKARDGVALARLILKSKRKNLMTILKYDDGWSDVGFDFHGLVSEFLRAPQGGWYIFASRGLLWHTNDFQAFEEVMALDDKQAFFDMKAVGEEILIMIGQRLHRLVDHSLVEFSPQLPVLEAGYTNLTSFGKQVAAIHPDGVMVLEDENWVRLHPEISS